MSFDVSRFTFDPWNDYAGVVMEQGRVQSDSDWNEWLAELSRRIQAGTLDTFGRAVYPATTPYAFQITASTSGGTNAITIGAGRMYVDGLLAENHGLSTNATWDPALAELSGSPQPPPPAITNTISYTQQPYYPNPDTTLLSGTGPLLAYLDVWTRPVTFLQDPSLIDPAIAVDTTGRLQTVWQVRLMAVPSGTTWTCATPDADIPYPAPSAGLLTTGTVTNPTAGPCCLTTGTGYSGVENQFYRVEIHNPGTPSDTANLTGATFKWSRDNASVETGVTAINSGSNSLNQPATVLTVLSLGRDQVLGFLPGNWIEILDDAHQLEGVPGELHLIDSIDAASRTITLTTTTSAAFPVGTPAPSSYTRIRRWDQAGLVYEADLSTVWWNLGAAGSNGTIPVPLSDKTLVLENGITVTFSRGSPTGSFNAGDFWTFAARTADGSVGPLTSAHPRGPNHHYTKLSIVSFNPLSNPDCRVEWPPGGAGNCGCCSCTVGDGKNSVGQFTSIQTAINSLPTTGGTVCILPGRYYEYVSIAGPSDVVLQGCGWQTRLASPSMKPGAPAAGVPTNPVTTESGLAAIITVVGSQHIQLRSFAVEAADGEAGILVDQFPLTAAKQAGQVTTTADIAIEELFVTASTLPAIVAAEISLLKIANNRIAMNDVSSQWSAIYASGIGIHIEQNWIGLQDATDTPNWAPASLIADLAQKGSQSFRGGGSPSPPLANGGIQIAGDSQHVFIRDNDIQGGRRNGITLGSFVILNANGANSGTLTGLVPTAAAAASGTITLQLPNGIVVGNTTSGLAAGGGLQDIQIERNRIRDMGLCGIGPVGFFDLTQTIEVISIENLTITANTISGTVQDIVAQFEEKASIFGYGAICIPDVQNLIVRDNTITDFGNTAGAQACGIFILNGEQVEISRNQVLETRDWTAIPAATANATNPLRAGILVFLVTPPALDQVTAGAAWASSVAAGSLASPVYQPGLPALRIENNVVRVPLGVALEAAGFGPFSIVANHLGSGGTVAVTSGTQQAGASVLGALTVLVLNLGLAIEVDNPGGGFASAYEYAPKSPLQAADDALASSSSGTVLFANNICQLESRASGAQGFTSVEILTLDHLIFSNNHCWLDGPDTAIMDALLLAGSLQACGNRFQESAGSVLLSGLTFAQLNITMQNISTYCLLAQSPSGLLLDGSNLILDSALCSDLAARK